MAQLTDCVFCQKNDIIMENDLAKAFWDLHPVRLGHLLVVPKDHYATYFDVPQVTRQAMDALLFRAKAFLDQQYHPAGYNVGVNVNPAGGQSVMHAHIHLIPRYTGDVKDPRGGDAQFDSPSGSAATLTNGLVSGPGLAVG